MKYVEFKNNLEDGQACAVYLFEGEDAFFRERGLSLLKSRFVSEPELNLVTLDSDAEVSEIISSLEGYPFLSEKREDNMVAGNSMGGYGALKAALTCPEIFGICGSLSGSVDITRKGLHYNLAEWQSIFGYTIQSAEELKGTKHDLFALAENLVNQKKPVPKIYMWCGEGDGLLKGNQAFSEHLKALDIPHTFCVTEGNHCWYDWDRQVQDVLAFWQANE